MCFDSWMNFYIIPILFFMYQKIDKISPSVSKYFSGIKWMFGNRAFFCWKCISWDFGWILDLNCQKILNFHSKFLIVCKLILTGFSSIVSWFQLISPISLQKKSQKAYERLFKREKNPKKTLTSLSLTHWEMGTFYWNIDT